MPTIEADAAAKALLEDQWDYTVWNNRLTAVLQKDFDSRHPPTKGEYIIISIYGPSDGEDFGHYGAHIDKHPVAIEVHSLRSHARMIAGKNEIQRILDLARIDPALLNVGDGGSSYRKLWRADRGQDISSSRAHKWIIKTLWEENLTGY